MTPVVAVFTAKSGSESVLERMFRGVIEATHNEDGCVSYQLNRDVAEPRRFVWTEVWADRASLEKHLAAPHIAELFAAVGEHVEDSEVITLEPVAGGASNRA